MRFGEAWVLLATPLGFSTFDTGSGFTGAGFRLVVFLGGELALGEEGGAVLPEAALRSGFLAIVAEDPDILPGIFACAALAPGCVLVAPVARISLAVTFAGGA